MKKSGAMFASMWLFFLIMAACQPTPEEDIIANKRETKIEEIAANSPVPNAPEAWEDAEETFKELGMFVSSEYDAESEEQIIHSKGSISIGEDVSAILDVDVIIPKTERWPVYRVEKRFLSAEDKEKIIECMAENSTIYAGTYNLTKAEFAQMIVDAEGTEEAFIIDNGYAREGSTTTVRSMLEEHMEEAEIINQETLFLWNEVEKEPQRDHLCHFYNSFVGEEMNCRISENAIRFSFSKYMVQTATLVYNGDLYGASAGRMLDNPSIPFEEAESISLSLMEKIGLEGMVLSFESTIAQRVNLYTGKRCSEGWMMVYRKAYNGLPCIGQEKIAYNGEEEYSEPWPQEKFLVYVDSDGCWNCQWDGPSQIGDTISEDATLLSFGTVWDKIQQQLKMENIRSIKKGSDIIIKELRLGYVIIPEQDVEYAGYAIPAWLVMYEMDTYLGRDFKKVKAFAINALDGSYIHIPTEQG